MIDPKEEALLSARLNDLAEKAKRIGVASSKFLSPAQAAQASRLFAKRRDILLTLDGGQPEAERVIAIFQPPEWGAFNRATMLCAIELRYRAQDSVSHRDILGAALGLGIERSMLGDILVEPGKAIVFCLPSIEAFLLENLTKAGRVGLQASSLPLEQVPQSTKTLEEFRGTVASLRIDAVIAEAFRCSRGQAEDYLRAGLVQLAHEECKSGSKLCKAGDMISVRGKGRCKLLSVGAASKKGRIWITVGRYG